MSVSKMPDGRWKVTCRYTTFGGVRKQKKKEGFPTKREAQQFEREFLQKMNGSLSMSMSSLLDLYLEDAKTRVKHTTYIVLTTAVETQFRPAFGDTPVQDVTPLAVRKWIARLQSEPSERTGKPLSTSSIALAKSRLSSVFNFAMKFYGLQSNPCANATVSKKGEKREMHFLTVQEFQKFRACESNELVRIAFDTLFWTGMRIGEMLALTADDVSEKGIRVNKTYLRLGGEEMVGTPKTTSSNRTVTIPAFLYAELKPIVDVAQGGGRIFEGTSAIQLRNHCKRNCEKAGVPVIRLHDLRHSHASMLIDRGVQPLLIAERLGHENVTITLRVYSHLYKAKRADLCSILEECYDSATH